MCVTVLEPSHALLRLAVMLLGLERARLLGGLLGFQSL